MPLLAHPKEAITVYSHVDEARKHCADMMEQCLQFREQNLFLDLAMEAAMRHCRITDQRCFVLESGRQRTRCFAEKPSSKLRDREAIRH